MKAVESVRQPERVSDTASARAVKPAAQSMSPLAQMQSALGNQAVQKLLRKRVLQPKLVVNRLGDVFEQEADRVADNVMRISDSAPATVQRACACGGTCEDCRAKSPDLQRASNSAADIAAPPVVNEFLRSSHGQAIDPEPRMFMEKRFGADFSGVRVHTGLGAAEAAQSVNARAFTVGNNVVFGNGQFAPATQSGRRLLAHELTHTIQQGAASSLMPDLHQSASGTELQRDVEDDDGDCDVAGVPARTVGTAAHKQIQATCLKCFAGVPGIPGAGENGGFGFPDLLLLWNSREAALKDFPLPSPPPADPLDVAIAEIGEIKPITYASGFPKHAAAVAQINRYITGWSLNQAGLDTAANPIPMTSFPGMSPVTFVDFPEYNLACNRDNEAGLYIYTCSTKPPKKVPVEVLLEIIIGILWLLLTKRIGMRPQTSPAGIPLFPGEGPEAALDQVGASGGAALVSAIISAGSSGETEQITTLYSAYAADAAVVEALKQDGAAFTAVGAVLDSVMPSPDLALDQTSAAILAGGPASGPGTGLLGSVIGRVPESPVRIAMETSLAAGSVDGGSALSSDRFAGDPTLEACARGEILIQVGSQGAAVQKIQQALLDARFSLPNYGADGDFGPETEAAVIAFQTASGLTGSAVDGVVGPITLTLLDHVFAPRPTPQGGGGYVVA